MDAWEQYDIGDPVKQVPQPELDVQLLTVNEYSRPGIATDGVRGVVVHYTANPGSTAQNNRDYFESLKDTGENQVSSNFIIGLDGEIIQCIPTNEIAYASNNRNNDTVSIECCHPDESGAFQEVTYQSLVELVAFLCGKFNLTMDNVIRHYDVTGKNRIAQIKATIEVTTSEFDKEKLQERLAKLAGGVAVIRVGAATETEMKEAKLRMEDALNATRAAVEEGIVAGGGSAYIHASKEVAKLVDTLEGDEKTGASVILKALEAPLHQIAANAGLEGAVIINKVRESEVGVGFDAYNEKYVNMVEEGILDPAKVTRSALQNATSVASTFLTTESCVANIKEETPAMPAGGAPGMGGMM